MFMDSPRAFAEFVRSQRLEQGLTQQELGKRTGMSRRWVQDLESGKHAPSLTAAMSVAAAFRYEWYLEKADDTSELDALIKGLS